MQPGLQAIGKQDVFPVRIQTPQGLVWEGSANVVSSSNKRGPFDILSDHANMFTIVEKTPIQIITPEGEKTFTFQKAVIAALHGSVVIFADIDSNAYLGQAANPRQSK